jgi:hypothetical protein
MIVELVKCYLNYRFEIEKFHSPSFLVHSHLVRSYKTKQCFYDFVISDCCFSHADQLARLFKSASQLELSIINSNNLNIYSLDKGKLLENLNTQCSLPITWDKVVIYFAFIGWFAVKLIKNNISLDIILSTIPNITNRLEINNYLLIERKDRKKEAKRVLKEKYFPSLRFTPTIQIPSIIKPLLDIEVSPQTITTHLDEIIHQVSTGVNKDETPT